MNTSFLSGLLWWHHFELNFAMCSNQPLGKSSVYSWWPFQALWKVSWLFSAGFCKQTTAPLLSTISIVDVDTRLCSASMFLVVHFFGNVVKQSCFRMASWLQSRHYGVFGINPPRCSWSLVSFIQRPTFSLFSYFFLGRSCKEAIVVTCLLELLPFSQSDHVFVWLVGTQLMCKGGPRFRLCLIGII
jgi:hypothetical protein